MRVSGQISKRRTGNADALGAFGITAASERGSSVLRVIREGTGTTVFTIGYERRDGEDLICALRDAGVAYLADVRDKPMSRKPDFRASALRARCEAEGIEYGAWSSLGSIESQREKLKETGDLAKFHKNFRAYAKRSLGEDIDQLAEVAQEQPIALLCYERAHEECHRSVIAALLADRIDAHVVAIL